MRALPGFAAPPQRSRRIGGRARAVHPSSRCQRAAAGRRYLGPIRAADAIREGPTGRDRLEAPGATSSARRPNSSPPRFAVPLRPSVGGLRRCAASIAEHVEHAFIATRSATSMGRASATVVVANALPGDHVTAMKPGTMCPEVLRLLDHRGNQSGAHVDQVGTADEHFALRTALFFNGLLDQKRTHRWIARGRSTHLLIECEPQSS